MVTSSSTYRKPCKILTDEYKEFDFSPLKLSNNRTITNEIEKYQEMSASSSLTLLTRPTITDKDGMNFLNFTTTTLKFHNQLIIYDTFLDFLLMS